MVTVIAADKTITFVFKKKQHAHRKPLLLPATKLVHILVTVGQWSTVASGGRNNMVYSFATQYTPDDIVPEDKEPMQRNKFPRLPLVWCNAYTEWTKPRRMGTTRLLCVYYTDSEYKTPIRNSASANYALTYYGSCDRTVL